MKRMHRFVVFLIPVACLVGGASAQPTPKKVEPPQVTLALYDQFENNQTVKQFEGDVLVLFYGDRKGMESNRDLGEKLHVHFHPDAKGKPPGKAQQTPVTPLPGLPDGQRSPEVFVVPVACIGKVPNLVKNVVRNQVKKGSPDVPVWLDFDDTMKGTFGLKEGEANLVVIDAWGRLRYKVAGAPDEATWTRLVQVIDLLRQERADAEIAAKKRQPK